jgi:hypothetical protein
MSDQDDGAIMLTGTVATSFAQLAALRGALRLEVAGMRRSRGPSAYALLRRIGYTGSRGSVLVQVAQDVEFLIAQPREGVRVVYLVAAVADQGAGWYVLTAEGGIAGGRFTSRAQAEAQARSLPQR